MARMTKNEKLAREGLMKNLVFLSQETWIPSTIALEVPEAWHTLEADVDVEEPKEKGKRCLGPTFFASQVSASSSLFLNRKDFLHGDYVGVSQFAWCGDLRGWSTALA